MIIYLYVKTHNKTGLKYLGITTNDDPHSYTGSGIYWKNHLKTHGYDYNTIILKECKTREEVKTWGLYYSELWNIVDEVDGDGNKVWANLTFESGTGGKTTEISPNKNKTTVRDNNNNTFMVDVNDERLKTGELQSINKHTVNVKDKNENCLRVHKEDERLKSGELIHYFSNKTCVVDENGNRVLISNESEKFTSGKVKHILSGKVTAIDENGNTIKVCANDHRFHTGELKSYNKGKVSVIDKDGNSFYVSVDDPRYVIGELVFFGGPKKGYKQPSVACPHCKKVGGISNMKRHHFDNCKFK